MKLHTAEEVLDFYKKSGRSKKNTNSLGAGGMSIAQFTEGVELENDGVVFEEKVKWYKKL